MIRLHQVYASLAQRTDRKSDSRQFNTRDSDRLSMLMSLYVDPADDTSLSRIIPKAFNRCTIETTMLAYISARFGNSSAQEGKTFQRVVDVTRFITQTRSPPPSTPSALHAASGKAAHTRRLVPDPPPVVSSSPRSRPAEESESESECLLLSLYTCTMRLKAAPTQCKTKQKMGGGEIRCTVSAALYTYL